jgi:hypothetical protein
MECVVKQPVYVCQTAVFIILLISFCLRSVRAEYSLLYAAHLEAKYSHMQQIKVAATHTGSKIVS